MFLFLNEQSLVAIAVSLLLLDRAQGLDRENRGSSLRKNNQVGEPWDTNNTVNKPVKKHHRLDQQFDAQSDTTTQYSQEERVDPGDERIIGGTNAAAGEFPFFVQGQGCGASLIWYDIALSAAHCYGSAFNSGVYIGNYRLNAVDAGVMTRNVVQQVRHPNYDPNNRFNNDLMILKLSSEVPRSGTIQPIQINNLASTPVAGAPLTAIGFGRTNPNPGSGSSTLLKVGVNYVAPTTCNTAWRGGINTTTHLCASALGKGICMGDSGGPIINSAGVQVGVSSFVTDCTKNSGVPDVYARTSGGYTWIQSQVCALASNRPSFCSTGTTTTSSVVLTVQADAYPDETAWTLKNSAGQTLASQNANSVFQANALIQKTLALPAGTYTFTMTDTYADGICCDYGNGYFTITVNGASVVSLYGVFGASIQRQFTIGARSFTPSDVEEYADTALNLVDNPARKEKPTGSASTLPCEDSAERTFKVNQNVGAWLQANMGNFGYLCELVKVATVCPASCSLCGSD